MVYLVVARLAQTHEVNPCMGAAFADGNDVVDFIHRGQPSFGKTPFTQWVSRCVTVTHSLPRSAILPVDIRGADIFVVALFHLLSVFLAVLSVREVGAAGKAAGAFRFSWHFSSSTDAAPRT